MPTATYDGTILSILAIVVAALLAERFWERRQDAKEIKERIGADVALAKAILEIKNAVEFSEAKLDRGHRAIFDAVSTLTQTTTERERQRRRDD